MNKTQIKKEILELIGQESLSNYYDYCTQDNKDTMLETILNHLEISEDDVEVVDDCCNGTGCSTCDCFGKFEQ